MTGKGIPKLLKQTLQAAAFVAGVSCISVLASYPLVGFANRDASGASAFIVAGASIAALAGFLLSLRKAARRNGGAGGALARSFRTLGFVVAVVAGLVLVAASLVSLAMNLSPRPMLFLVPGCLLALSPLVARWIARRRDKVAYERKTGEE